MLWALEGVGLVTAGALTVNLAMASVAYAAWVLVSYPQSPERRSERR